MTSDLDDPLMHPLAVLCCGRDCDAREDECAFHVPAPGNPNRWLRISWSEFDQLIERGWVRYVGANAFEPTRAGRELCEAWLARERRKRRKAEGRKRKLLKRRK